MSHPETANSTLARLDSAITPVDLDVAADANARATLSRILASDPAPAQRPQPARGPRRLVAVGGAVAAGAAVALIIPTLSGGERAYAAWTASSHPVSDKEVAKAAKKCQPDGGAYVNRTPPKLTPRVADGRGPFTMVYLTDGTNGGSERTCLLENGDFIASSGSDPGPDAVAPPPVAPDSASAQLGAVYTDGDQALRMVSGRVGADVVGLVLETEAKGAVKATVADGYFAAWWPDTPTTEAQENADTTPEVTSLTATLRDGSTRVISIEELTGRTMAELTRPATGGGSDTGH